MRHPGRTDFEVVAGDSNETVAAVLDDVKRRKLDCAAMFAFIDPYNLGVRWSTLESLARSKAHSKNKVELWILCFSSAIPRVSAAMVRSPSLPTR